MMDQNSSDNFKRQSPKKPSKLFFSERSTVAVYTTLRVLVKMRRRLGIEAMLEYLDKSLKILESCNPKIKSAVTQALDLVSVERMYDDIR